jgi:signal transduction histidine kinase
MKAPLSPEILVPRLGEYLVLTGQISKEGLNKGLAYQAEKLKAGREILLGEALIELKLLDRARLDQAVTEQIIQLRNALENANRMLEQRVVERTAELQEALRKISELSQLKANFVANISHELRTPLTHIKGYLELLHSEALGELAPEQKKALEVSQRSSSQLENLIDSLILFSLTSRGEMSMQLTPVDLTKVAQNVISFSKAKAEQRKVDLSLEIPPGLPTVRADEQKIAWVILQLVDNAIKFTPSGGRVALVITAETRTLVRVAVSDTGIGIPQDRLDEVFEPFHQLDGSSTRRYGGTGLGLALVQEIITAHASIIEVQSEEGKGSSFHFLLLASEPVKESERGEHG